MTALRSDAAMAERVVRPPGVRMTPVSCVVLTWRRGAHLAPLSGNARRSSDMPCLVYAAIVGQATNLGLSGVARASEFSYQQLEWAWEQLCREDTLTAARAAAGGTSTTGCRSPRNGAPAGSRPLTGSGSPAVPEASGLRRCRATSATAAAACSYSWTSDQYSQYASKVVTASVR